MKNQKVFNVYQGLVIKFKEFIRSMKLIMMIIKI